MEVHSPETRPWALPTRGTAPAEAPVEGAAQTDEVEDEERDDFRAHHGRRRHRHHHDHEGRGHRMASDMGRRVAMGRLERELNAELKELSSELRSDLAEAAEVEEGETFEAAAFLEDAISALGEFAAGLEEAFQRAEPEHPGRGRGHRHGHRHRVEHRAMRLERRYERMQGTLDELMSQLQGMLDAIRGEDERPEDEVPDVPITTGDPIREPRPDAQPTVAPEGAETRSTA